MLTGQEAEALRLSVLIAGRAALVGMPFAFAAAWALSRWRFPGRTLFDALVHAPLVLPPVVVGYLLLLLFGVQGPLGRLLETMGVRLVFTSTGASLAAGIMAFPLMVRAIRQALDAVDPALEAAARGLGAGFWDRLATITLPLAAPGLVAALVVGFAAALGEFGAVITFAANVPGETRTLPLAIYSAIQMPGGDAAAFRLAAISFTVAIAALVASEALLRAGRRLGVH